MHAVNPHCGIYLRSGRKEEKMEKKTIETSVEAVAEEKVEAITETAAGKTAAESLPSEKASGTSESGSNVKNGKKRKDVRKLKTVSPMATIAPFIMSDRIGSSNLISTQVNIIKLEKYIKEKQQSGEMKNLSMMHVLIAAYIRLVSQRPAINRFIRGQRIFSRRTVVVSLTIKKEMLLDSPDTVVKIKLEPDATIYDVYEKLNQVIVDYRDNPGGDFDNTAKALSYIPALVLRGIIGILRGMDYLGLFPKFLEEVSPFHCSMFITSMGSLGIPAIFHHLYDFGTCPAFIAFGTKQRSYEINPDGTIYKKQYMDINYTLDERICDGYYYAKALKLYKAILNDPWQLDNPPDEVIEDID